MADPRGAIAKAAVTNPDDPEATDDIQFIEYHLPALPDGTYHIKVEQTVDITRKVDGSSALDGVKVESIGHLHGVKDMFFSVVGPRFGLDPQDIRAVFPPEGSAGDHANVLPHIVLNRSTLPWERQAIHNVTHAQEDINRVTPWLALLLFDELDPPPVPRTLPVSKLMAEEQFTHLPAQITGDHADAPVTVIDVDRELLGAILPRVELSKEINELGLLAHVRQTYAKAGSGPVMVDGEVAVVIGNRLPRDGSQSTVHLVSLEHRYDGKDDGKEGATGFVFPPDQANVTLVSLKSWRFACDAQLKGSFQGLLMNLDCNPMTLRLPNPTPDPDADASTAKAACRFVEMGYTPLPHYLRTGDKTVSWYHGPLAPGIHDNKHPDLPNQLPARTADALARCLPEYGMLDVSYAAAWELGRLLTLQSKQVATTLYQWKRTHAAAIKNARSHLDHLPFAKLEGDADLPDVVQQWFGDLALLCGVPFDYLVPDPRMLPVESIRFFRVDPYWVECLLDGAFSIGRMSEADRQREQPADTLASTEADSQLSGFLLRSAVVSGWPDLQVDGYSADINDLDAVQSPHLQLPLVRMERLSPNVLLCLFAGEVKTVDIHLKPETLHFGVSPVGVSPEDERHSLAHYPGGYYKELRSLSGEQDVAAATPRPADEALAAALDQAAALQSPNLTAEVLELLPKAGEGLTSLVVEAVKPDKPGSDKPGSEWRINAEQTVVVEKTKITLHWTFNVQRAGDALTVHDTLAVNVPSRAGVALTESNDSNKRRVLAIHELQQELQVGLKLFSGNENNQFTAAEFALEMVEGVQKVRFTISDGIPA